MVKSNWWFAPEKLNDTALTYPLIKAEKQHYLVCKQVMEVNIQSHKSVQNT
jgi:hypothetical protein